MGELIVDSFKESRMAAANKALIEGYEALEPADSNYWKNVESLSKLHQAIAAETTSANEAVVNLEKLKNEKNRDEMTRINESEKIRIEEEHFARMDDIDLTRLDNEVSRDLVVKTDLEERRRLEEEHNIRMAKYEPYRIGIDAAKGFGALGLGIAGIFTGIWKFKRATAFEEKDAFVTTTARTTVTDALRDSGALEKNWQPLNR